MDTTVEIHQWDGVKIIIGNQKRKDCFSFNKNDLNVVDEYLNKKSDEIKIKSNKERLRRISHTAHLLTAYQDPQKIMEIIGITSIPVFISYLKIIDYEIQKLHQKTRQ